MTETLYELLKPEHPWGDYGSILFHGMSCHLGRRGAQIQLERTGPFVPPISFPGFEDVLFTTAARNAFDAQEFTGAEFRRVRKTRIVRLDWETWDRTSAEPFAYPEEGDPEGYILDRRHDPRLAQAIGDIWELVPKPIRGLRSTGGRVRPEKHPGLDVCVATHYGTKVILSRRVRDWLRKEFPEWVRLKPVSHPAAA